MITAEQAAQIALGFVRAVEAGDRDRAVAYLAPDVVHEERPNRLFPHGARRDRAAIVDGIDRGRAVLTRQTYDVKNVVATPSCVLLEIQWTGTLAVAMGQLPVGGQLRAHIAGVTEVRDGKIVALRNYDCYEPF